MERSYSSGLMLNFRVNKFFWTFLFLYPVLYNFVGGVSNAQRLMHVVMLLCLLFCLVFFKPQIPKLKVLFLVFIYTLLVVSYYLFCTILFTEDKSWGDFADIVRPFVYFMYMSIPMLYPLNDKQLKKLFKYLFFLVVLSIVFSALVYFPVFYPLVDLYKGRMSDDNVIMHFFRWSGTFGYPSDFSFLLSLFVYIMFFKYVFDRRNVSIKFWILFFILFTAIVMTVSRGGIFSVLFMLGCCYLFSPAFLRFRVNVIILPIVFSLLVAFFYVQSQQEFEILGTDIKYLTTVIDSNGNVGDSSSRHRVREFEYALNYFIQYFPFGSGANRIEILGIINPLESFYGYHFIKWGFFGYLLHMSFLIFLIAIVFVKVKTLAKGELDIKALYFGFVPFILSVPLIFGFSSAMSDRFKVVAVYYLVCGYILCNARYCKWRRSYECS
ncbi:O-antigen ligase family protein [Shewanella algae]|uniref:O-antigen ligase family protein n=1 Tax=Shewanella algae TaxID=38313 RepID=UPI0031F53F68